MKWQIEAGFLAGAHGMMSDAAVKLAGVERVAQWAGRYL